MLKFIIKALAGSASDRNRRAAERATGTYVRGARTQSAFYRRAGTSGLSSRPAQRGRQAPIAPVQYRGRTANTIANRSAGGNYRTFRAASTRMTAAQRAQLRAINR